MRKLNLILAAVFVLIILVSCAPKTPATPPSPSGSPQAPGSSTPPSEDPLVPSPTPRVLSDSELSMFNEAFDIPGEPLYLYNFLRCTYNSPREIDPNSIFYAGAGACIPPTDEILDYLIENGYLSDDYRELTDFAAGSAWIMQPADIEEVMQKRFGISFSEVQIEFIKFIYLERFGVYFDTITDSGLSVSPLVTSGEYIGDNTYVVEYADYWSDNIYSVTFMLLNNDLDTIQFISNIRNN